MAVILVVDDDIEIQGVIKFLLERHGHMVEVASKGTEALDKIKEVKPDLVLLDFILPDMSGRETCEKIYTMDEGKNLKIIFLTGTTFTKEGMDGLRKMNVCDFIQKPFSNQVLIDAIKKALENG